jgi:xylulose-5-phosphate/fructose-6-phosphate phosphoketolase
VPHLGARAAYAKQFIRDKLVDHKAYVNRYGEDMPEIRDWRWSVGEADMRAAGSSGVASPMNHQSSG